jgi:hypothetical protein
LGTAALHCWGRARLAAPNASVGAQETALFCSDFGREKQKRIPFFENEPERLLKTKDRRQKRTENEPKNEAEKLLKTRTCGKNEPKNEPGHVVENKRWPKNEPESKTCWKPPARSRPATAVRSCRGSQPGPHDSLD